MLKLPDGSFFDPKAEPTGRLGYSEQYYRKRGYGLGQGNGWLLAAAVLTSFTLAVTMVFVLVLKPVVNVK